MNITNSCHEELDGVEASLDSKVGNKEVWFQLQVRLATLGSRKSWRNGNDQPRVESAMDCTEASSCAKRIPLT